MDAKLLVDKMIARSRAARAAKEAARRIAEEAARKADEEAANERILVSFARVRVPMGCRRRPKRDSLQKAVALHSN